MLMNMTTTIQLIKGVDFINSKTLKPTCAVYKFKVIVKAFIHSIVCAKQFS